MFITAALLLVAVPALKISDLRCEYSVDPMNVDTKTPHLSWKVGSDQESQRQTGFQIIAADNLGALSQNQGNLWNSGKISSSETLEIAYAGAKLQSASSVYWKVRVWDSQGTPSGWSEPAHWMTGILDSVREWRASWIDAGATSKAVTLDFRNQFRLRKPIKRAVSFSTGLGQYELWLNGGQVGKDWLKPGWTQYAKTVLTDSYDVTSLLRQGANCVAMHVGNGMYDMSLDARGGQQTRSWGTKKVFFQLMVWYEDGSRDLVTSSPSWKVHEGPESYSGVYGGEDWDARKEVPGWKLPGFDDHAWAQAQYAVAPDGELRGLTHANPPLRVMEVRQPVDATEPKPMVLVLDLGQNAPYVPQISVMGVRGASITMSPAEVLKADGTMEQQTMRAGKHCTYTLGGNGVETWHPAFWYCGARYWQIEAHGPDGKPIDPKSVLRGFSGLMVRADIPGAGSFTCSSDLFNKTEELIRWAMLSNFASVISDCPHREKSGWLEEDHLVGEGLMYSFDMSTMFRKVTQDMADTQLPNGMVPTMAPEYFIYDGGFRDSVEWGGCYLLLPQLASRFYGQKWLVASHLDSMKRYLTYLGTVAKDGILSNGLGDWNGAGTDPRTPVAITDTAYYFALLNTGAAFDLMTGGKTDSERLLSTAEHVKSRFRASFFDKATGKVGSGSQSAQATALDLGLIAKADEPQAFAQLLADVEAHGYGVDCGEIGHPALLRVLTRFGRADLVAKIHLQTERPGYGYQIKKGLTTLAECWDASLNSYNHFMLGHLMNWFYGDLAGIKPDSAGAAFSKIIIRPHLIPQITWVHSSYQSIRGNIRDDWKTEGDRCRLSVTIPANTTATVYVPAKAGTAIRMTHGTSKAFSVFVSQKPVDGYEPVTISSGSYLFDSVYR